MDDTSAAVNGHVRERRDDEKHNTNNKNSTDCCTNGKRLLKWSQVPAHLKFNPYIHEGYRPLTTSTGCIKSLCYFHNETVNILTHGLPVLYIAFVSPSLIPWHEISVPFLPYTHLAALLSPWVGSAIYHTFMNHHHGHGIYRRLLQLDMLGIWVTQSFGALTGVITATYCLPIFIGYSIVLLYCLTCIWGLYKAFIAGSSGSPWDRRLCFFFPVLIRLTLVLLRTFGSHVGYTAGPPESVAYIWLQDAIAILGGVIGALRVPERYFPGKFDFFFNSHHIMHVLVLVAVVHMHHAAMLDLKWLSSPQCSSTLSTLARNFTNVSDVFSQQEQIEL